MNINAKVIIEMIVSRIQQHINKIVNHTFQGCIIGSLLGNLLIEHNSKNYRKTNYMHISIDSEKNLAKMQDSFLIKTLWQVKIVKCLGKVDKVKP